MCGKILTDDNVCPIPNGTQCTGQLFTRGMARIKLMPYWFNDDKFFVNKDAITYHFDGRFFLVNRNEKATPTA